MLIFFHLEKHVSARHMLQVLEKDDFARKNIAPQDGIKKSSFAEAIKSRGLEQLQIVFEKLSRRASGILPNRHLELGDLVALDGFVKSYLHRRGGVFAESNFKFLGSPISALRFISRSLRRT